MDYDNQVFLLCDHCVLVLPCCYLGCWMNFCIGAYPYLTTLNGVNVFESWSNPWTSFLSASLRIVLCLLCTFNFFVSGINEVSYSAPHVFSPGCALLCFSVPQLFLPAVNSSLSILGILASCVSVFHSGCRTIGDFGGWMLVGLVASGKSSR